MDTKAQDQKVHGADKKEPALTKKFLGKEKKMRNELEISELRSKAKNRFINHLDKYSSHQAGYLEADSNETTRQFRQKSLLEHVPIANKKQIMDQDLEYGSYSIDFSRDGQELLMGGSSGQVCLLEWKNKKLRCEFNTKEKIRDVKFLHNNNFLAVAQKNNVCVYDSQGIELHNLKNMPEPVGLEYLPYHFLLASLSNMGSLVYQDVSTGRIVAEHKTKVREATCLRQNPYNAILCTGNRQGVIKMWTPNTGISVAELFCHQGVVLDCAINKNGTYMATTGSEGKLKVWDIRMFKEVYEYWCPKPCNKIAISDTGLLALSYNFNSIIWKDWHLEKQKSPYMKQETTNKRVISDLQFVPFEDFQGVGQQSGFSTWLIPGAGFSDYDTFEGGPGVTKRQRREIEVKKLLDKIPADTIALNPDVIGTIDRASKEVKEKERKAAMLEAEAKRLKNLKKKNKQRGREGPDDAVLKRQTKRDEVFRDRQRIANMERSKIRMAEKVKAKKEIDYVNENLDQLNSLPGIINKKIRKQS